MRESGFKRLAVWEKGVEIAKEIYVATKKFPEGERFGLVSQMRRAAVSVPSNVAEGYSRKNQKEFKQFLYIALGSLGELETQLILANKFGRVHSSHFLFDLLDHERSMLLRLCQSNQ